MSSYLLQTFYVSLIEGYDYICAVFKVQIRLTFRSGEGTQAVMTRRPALFSARALHLSYGSFAVFTAFYMKTGLFKCLLLA